MSSDQSEETRRERRAAIEDELRQRLARDAGAFRSSAGVSLLCVACQGINTSDARFCKHCGVQFNAIVMAQGSPSPSGGTASS
jgi:hypothetical protein